MTLPFERSNVHRSSVGRPSFGPLSSFANIRGWRTASNTTRSPSSNVFIGWKT